jgi:hypothetical protein
METLSNSQLKVLINVDQGVNIFPNKKQEEISAIMKKLDAENASEVTALEIMNSETGAQFSISCLISKIETEQTQFEKLAVASVLVASAAAAPPSPPEAKVTQTLLQSWMTVRKAEQDDVRHDVMAMPVAEKKD